MTEADERQFVIRLRRLVGQAESLEGLLATGDRAKFVGQLQAVVAAGQAALSHYAQTELLLSDSAEDKKLVARLIRRN